VIDGRLRGVKDRLVDPVAGRLPAGVSPGRLTLASLAVGLAAAALAAGGMRWWALAAWLVGRVLDGIDGAVARRRGCQSDLGGYLDLMGDTVGYTAIPLGIAISQHDARVWVACAVLLGSFYLNTMSWTLLSAIAEKRSRGATAHGERTTVHMPSGLVEGTETIVLFSLMLALPTQALVLFWAMATLVAITVVQRVVWAWRSIGNDRWE
jgi:phosphatidylglycerophosphate synthase